MNRKQEQETPTRVLMTRYYIQIRVKHLEKELSLNNADAHKTQNSIEIKHSESIRSWNKQSKKDLDG